jgi:hypothetical protein
MNLRFWQRDTEDDEEEEVTPLPMPVAPSKAELRAQRMAAEARKPAPTTVSPADVPPDPGERFYAGFIGVIHVSAPVLISLLIGVSTGYFLSNFHLAADLPTAIGMSGGILVAGVDLAIVMQKRRASKYGDDEKAMWLMIAALAFGAVSILTQYIYLQINLTAAADAEATLVNIPVLGLLIGLGGGSIFVLVRAAIYHAALYASAWGLGDIAPSPEKLVKWQMQQHIRLQTESVLREVRQRGSVTVSEAPQQATLAAPRQQKDLLAIIQQLQQQVTEMQVRQRATTGQFRSVEPEEESEGSGNGRTTFRS